MKFQKSTWLVLLNLVGLGVLFAALQWNSITMPFERDEGEYAYSAWIMKEGYVPYRDSFLQKPPMIVYTYLASQLIDADAVWPPRVFASLFTLLTALTVGLAAKHLYGNRTAWLSVWMFLPLSMLPIFLPYAANTERFLLLPLCVLFYLYVCFGAQARSWVWMTAGIVAAIAILFKQVALVPAAIVFVLWGLEAWRQQRSAMLLARNVGVAVLSGVVVLVVALAFFIYRGALHDLIVCTVTYNYYYSQVGGDKLQFFLAMMGFLAEEWWPLIPLVGWYVYKRPPRWKVITILFVAMLVIASQDLNGHYYMLLVPFLAIIGSAGMDSLLGWLGARFEDKVMRERIAIMFSCVVILVLILPLRGIFPLRPDELSELVYSGNPFVESSIVAQRVRQLLPETERLFVAGSEPQILFESKRLSLTRFVIMYPLTMPTPFMEKYQEEVKAAIEKDPPNVVVVCIPKMTWFYQTSDHPEIVDYIERTFASKGYLLVGGYVRDRSGSHWEEPLAKNRIPLCRLLILKRGQSTS